MISASHNPIEWNALKFIGPSGLFLDAAGVSTMDIWPDGGVAVRSVNETSHLR